MNWTEEQPVVVFEHVGKRYGNGTQGLNDVSFSVYPGEFIAVIGPSGAGKSTLLRSVNKLHDVTEGRILIGGEDISKARGSRLRTLRRQIGMIFQNYNLVYRLSVLQNVLHGRLGYMGSLQGMIGRYREEDKEKAVELLKEIDMGDFLNTRAADLSGGQKQRVGIARAFMQEPQILLCDEPIASLDPSSAKIIMDMIYSMASRRRIACLVNLHQIDVAKAYATRVIGLRKGTVVFDGPPGDMDDCVIQAIYGVSADELTIKERNL